MEKRIGVCNNPDCDLCLSREHQEIEFGEEFVCRECGKPLKEFEEKKRKKTGNKLPLIIGAAVILIGGLVAILTFGGKSEPTPLEEPITIDSANIAVEVVEEPVVEDTLAEEPQEQLQTETEQSQEKPVKPKVSKLDLGYATYEPLEGASGIKDGKPHGNGIMHFKSRQTIPGTEDCVAEPGEWVNGAWRDGKINAGTWYRNDGNQVIVKLGQRYNKQCFSHVGSV